MKKVNLNINKDNIGYDFVEWFKDRTKPLVIEKNITGRESTLVGIECKEKFSLNIGNIKLSSEKDDLEDLNLRIEAIPYICKSLEFYLPIKKVLKIKAIELCRYIFTNEYEYTSDYLVENINFWKKKVEEFMFNNPGIVLDYKSDYYYVISRNVAPCLIKELNINNKVEMNVRDSQFEENLVTASKVSIPCPDDQHDCLVNHFKYEYKCSFEQVKLIEKFNSNKLNYTDHLKKWQYFYDQTLEDRIQEKLKMLSNEEYIDFIEEPNIKYILNFKTDKSKIPLKIKWRNHIITEGVILDPSFYLS